MPFFKNSSSIIVNDGYFSDIGGDLIINVTAHEPAAEVVAQLLGKRKKRDGGRESDGDRLGWKRPWCNSRHGDGLMIVDADEVDLHKELFSGNSYRMHSGSYGGQVVAVKVFEGPHAKQNWTQNVSFSKKFLHSNVLRVIGVSGEDSETPFVVFRGVSEKRMQSVIAKALRTDLKTSILLSMKAVKGLAAGLSYMRSQKIPTHAATMSDNRRWENFDIFASESGEPVIAIHPLSSIPEGESLSPPLDSESEGSGIESLTGLCQKLFSAANAILYDDSPERQYKEYDAGHIPITSQRDPVGPSEGSETDFVSDLCDTQKLNRTPRREVWWRHDLGTSQLSLDSIARRFEDYLDCFLSLSSDYPLRRIRGSKRADSRLNSHRCPGYLREEITLTPDVARSAIISHDYPSQSELCLVCGQLVQYASVGENPHVSKFLGLDSEAPSLFHPLPYDLENASVRRLRDECARHDSLGLTDPPSSESDLEDMVIDVPSSNLSSAALAFGHQPSPLGASSTANGLPSVVFVHHPQLMAPHLVNLISDTHEEGYKLGPQENLDRGREPTFGGAAVPLTPILNFVDTPSLSQSSTMVLYHPPQPCKYITPSTTSRKELPAAFSRKRLRSVRFSEEDLLEYDMPPNPTEMNLILTRRRQNIIAARRSRMRRLELTNMLLGRLHSTGIDFSS